MKMSRVDYRNYIIVKVEEKPRTISNETVEYSIKTHLHA